MGRLFWKFFLAFWLALLLAGAAVGSLVWLHQQRVARDEPALAAGPRAALALQAAAATLRHGGVPALRALLGDAAPPWSAAVVYAVDRDGKDLLGRDVPADALERARGLAARPVAPRAARAVRYDDASGLLLFVPFAADGTIRPAPRPARFGRPAEPLPPVLLGAIGLLASVAFSALLAWSLTRPIRHLRRAVASVAEGRLDTRVAPLMGRRADEIADLGRDFDQMAHRLQQLVASQRRLLHDVSHELRSPLARLQAAVGLARQDPERTASMLERIEREANRLDGLVGELLALARLEAGNALPPLERVDLVELVEAIVDDARFEARASGRDVSFAGADPVMATARAELLHRAFENVIRNAVKYTREGTAVEVRVGLPGAPVRDGAPFVLSVADRGPGVPEPELEAIFEPFHRARNGAGEHGFGLGLAIARRAIEAHGGRIVARNRDGGGLAVEIEVPRG
ncbi:MAG: HAMP domain-containing protein [Burkholderiaceae bacterium]|nr:HAMP domain-containing protein [Burkholderiaceae bacterium]